AVEVQQPDDDDHDGDPDPHRQAQRAVEDLPGRRGHDRDDQDRQQDVDDVEQPVERADQALQQGPVVEGLEAPRDLEHEEGHQREPDADGNPGDPAQAPVLGAELHDLATGRVAAADEDALQDDARKEQPAVGTVEQALGAGGGGSAG